MAEALTLSRPLAGLRINAARLKERNLVAQLKARDEGTGRWIEIRDGKIRSGARQHATPDITLSFKNAAIGASLLTPPIE